MTFSITPHIGAGTLCFGMSRTDIQAQLAGTPKQFLRAGIEDTDFYEALGLFVLYNDTQTCVALEFTRPARVLLADTSLLPLSNKKAIALFAMDPALEQDEAGYTCHQQGIGAYYEESKRAESMIAFAAGYYSS